MTESLSNSVHTNLDIFETVHSRLDSCWRCLNLIWKAVTKRCGFYEPISNWFHVNERPIRAKKNMPLANIRILLNQGPGQTNLDKFGKTPHFGCTNLPSLHTKASNPPTLTTRF